MLDADAPAPRRQVDEWADPGGEPFIEEVLDINVVVSHDVVDGMAVSAEAAKCRIGPFVLNAQAPDEGNQHTLLHWGTELQKEKYLRPSCEGRFRSCFAMTEPEVAGSDPTLIQTRAAGPDPALVKEIV